MRRIHREFGREKVREAFQHLGGSVVWEDEERPLSRYHLTFLGALLTSEGPTGEGLLVRYLDFVRRRFIADPEILKIEGKDVEKSLRLTKPEADLLKELVQLGNLWAGSAGFGADAWDAGVPEDIEDLPTDEGGLLGYLRDRALREYDPKTPVDGKERFSYLMSKRATSREGTGAETEESLGEVGQPDFAFVEDLTLRGMLEQDWAEAQRTFRALAWKSTVILCGSVLEGMLMGACVQLERRNKPFAALLKERSRRSVETWALEGLISAAEDIRMLRTGPVRLTQALKEYRDLVHPGKQKRFKIPEVSEDDATMALSVVRICQRELLAFSENS